MKRPSFRRNGEGSVTMHRFKLERGVATLVCNRRNTLHSQKQRVGRGLNSRRKGTKLPTALEPRSHEGPPIKSHRRYVSTSGRTEAVIR